MIKKPKEVIEKVCQFLELKEEDVMSKNKVRELADARHIIFYILYNDEYISMTQQKIGSMFNTDHSCVCFGIKKVADLLSVSDAFRTKYQDVKSFVYAQS